LDEHIGKVITPDTVFADLFAGTGAVSHYFKDKVYKIVGNDAEYYSYVVNYARIKSRYSDKLKNIIMGLNSLQPTQGLVYTNFAVERQFFTESNASKIDAMRQDIEKMKEDCQVDKDEYIFLLASLLVASDKVANTASVYGAYLKKFKSSALKDIQLKPLHTDFTSTPSIPLPHEIFNEDTLKLIGGKTFDVVYIDPPYNHRQYSANYSFLNYLCLYDETISVQGKGGIIPNYFKSPFCRKADVLKSFDILIQNTNAQTIFVSYNNEGILSKQDLVETFTKYGDVQVHVQVYKKFVSQKADGKKSEKCVEEYLFQINKLV
jgi:adenine-specific DNA-methyltransferase